ncbi:MAG TPA: hypothetical protein VGL47_37450 [Amycolatopsis sp.]|uniref:hypothetical protein n=1 Tax=Amycolatopsis sp. TaxID=37632 RepID=UPI002F3F4CA8
MSRAWAWVPVLLATACGAQAAPGPVETAVREYVALRNAGDLRGLLGKSCGALYTSTSRLLAESPDRRREVTASMRAHPVDVESVVVETSGDHVFGATLTGSARTPDGRRSASQHVEVRQYRDGYRVCALTY